MPHLVLEYSENAIAASDVHDLLSKLHGSLAKSGIDESRIKTRAVELTHFIVGRVDSEVRASMMHLTLSLLEGRDDATKTSYARPLHAIMCEMADTGCQVTVEVRDMRRATYFM